MRLGFMVSCKSSRVMGAFPSEFSIICSQLKTNIELKFCREKKHVMDTYYSVGAVPLTCAVNFMPF